jgi:hypothetical protein
MDRAIARRLDGGAEPARGADRTAARPPLGTLAWARATGGILDRRERVRMIASGLGLLLTSLPARVRQTLGVRSAKAIRADLDRLPVPDSAAARRAEDLLSGTGSVLTVNHSHRSYVWATLLGMLADRRPDQELLYVASLLHDLTLTDRYRDGVPEIRCFGGKGAVMAARFATQEWGWSDRRAEALGDAICLHLNTSVPPEQGVEAHLLHAAAALDVIGHGHWMIAPETMSAVIARYPRAGMKEHGLQMFLAVSHPGTRTHLLNRRLMFPTLVRRSQFDE